MKLAWLMALVALALAAAAGAQPGGGVQQGNYTVLEGPLAGLDLHVAKDGHVSITDQAANAMVAPADDNCNGPHLVGTIGGKAGKLGGCGWGRVVLLAKVTPLVRSIANAITEEERAVASILDGSLKPGGKQHWELALYGQLGVEHALDALAAAEKAGEIAPAKAAKIRRRLEPAQAIDEKVKKQMQADASPTAAVKATEVRQLRNGLSLKREAFAMAVDELDLAPKCTVEKEFDLFAVPAGFAGAYSEVFPHGVPKGAKHVKASFVDTATGKAPPENVFPGQTWSVQLKGFRPDGTFDVRVNVTGKGFGKPDANSRHWKVVVSFDCP